MLRGSHVTAQVSFRLPVVEQTISNLQQDIAYNSRLRALANDGIRTVRPRPITSRELLNLDNLNELIPPISKIPVPIQFAPHTIHHRMTPWPPFIAIYTLQSLLTMTPFDN
jgi:hypothetical protein